MNRANLNLAAAVFAAFAAGACISPPPPLEEKTSNQIAIAEVTPGHAVATTDTVSVKVTIPATNTTKKWGLYVDGTLKSVSDTDTIAAGTLTAGQHVLRAALHASDTEELNPPVRVETIVVASGAEKINISKINTTNTPAATTEVTVPYNAVAVTVFIENFALAQGSWKLSVDGAACGVAQTTTTYTVKNPTCFPFAGTAADCGGKACDTHTVKAELRGPGDTAIGSGTFTQTLTVKVLRPTIAAASLDPSPAGADIATPNGTDTYNTSSTAKLTMGAPGNFGGLIAKPDPATNEMGKGHLKYTLDGSSTGLTANETEAVSFEYTGLALGAHTLTASLVQNDGTAIPVSATVKINVIRKAGAQTFSAYLTGFQESPWFTGTNQKANASFTLNAAEDTITYEVTTAADTIDYTASHIHAGKAGEAGSVIVGLTTAAGTLDKDSTPAKKITGTIVPATALLLDFTFASLIDAIATGGTYVNVHTTANPGGHVRGQIGQVSMNAGLNGAQAGNATTGTGSAKFWTNADQTELHWTLDIDAAHPLTGDIQSAHIHGMTNGILFDMVTAPTTATSLSGTATAVATSQTTLNFKQALERVIAGGAYVNVHTVANGGGEIRGAIGAAFVNAHMILVPTTASLATGDARFRFNATQDKIGYSIVIDGDGAAVSDPPFVALSAHFHALPAPGNVVLGILSAATTFNAGTAVTGSIDATAAQASSILSGQTYVNFHTAAHADGEIRGDATVFDPWAP